MENLEETLIRLPDRHRAALLWFASKAGSEQPWPKALEGPEGEIFLASRAKGIYKPKWSQYALSVRQSLAGPYPDREPILRPDGTWLYSYFQENEDPSTRDDQFTNRGLLDCWRDRVPIGVMRQISSKPKPRYRVLGLALVAGWDGGYFFLEGFAPDGHARSRGPGGELELLTTKHEHQSLETGFFDPTGIIDARERIVVQIVRRRGQPEFRRRLLDVYGGRCAISGCNAADALEAAHICPYQGDITNNLQNGLLLRADLHTLFDFGLISIDPDNLTVLISSTLAGTSYQEFAGKRISLPADPTAQPSREALNFHRNWFGV